MFVEVLLHVEVLPAPLTHELFVSNVDTHVGAQLIFVLETLAAVLKRQTLQSPHNGRRLKRFKQSPKACSHLALEGLLSRVLQGVNLQGHAAFE